MVIVQLQSINMVVEIPSSSPMVCQLERPEVAIEMETQGPQGGAGIQGPPGPIGPQGSGAEDPGDLTLLFDNRLI